MSKKTEKSKSGNKSGPRFTLCVPPCKRYITSGDTHSMCVVCLGAEHAMSAFERTDCPHCEALPLRVLRSRKALFEEGAFTSVPQGVGPAAVEAERALHSWGSQLDLLEGMETGDPLSPSLPGRSDARSEGSEARTAATSSQGAGSSLLLSSSEEVDLESAIEEPLPQSLQYEELLEVVTRAVDKLNIDWPAKVKATPQRSKLDERFLRSKPPPPMRSLPFFPDLHSEISRSWERPFSARLFVSASDYYGNVVGLDERAYKAMPRVEQTLASYLSLKAPTLPSKPLRTTSALVGKGYSAAGQAGACLHTMSVLQAYQADLLKGLAEGEKVDLEELQRTADLALRATKETARAVGRTMAAMVAAERHLWLTLSDMKEKDRVFLLDAPLQPSGLFGDVVDSVVSRYQEARKQAAAFQRFLPRRSLAPTAAGREQPSPSTSSSYRQVQKLSVATRAPPSRDRDPRHSRPGLGGPRPQSGPDARPGPPRAAPTGEERVTPHYTVAVSPRCPREVDLLFLPRLQDTTASDELLPRISPPGNVAEPGCSSPPRGSLEQLARQSPAGPPLQVSELVVQSNPEASLEWLVPLVDYLAAWKLLPNVSAWVLRTVEKGHAIQFGAPPPPFDRVFPTLVGPKQALVMEQEVETLLRKEAIEVVPPHARESGFYSRYFIVPKKDGGLRPIIDLRRLNHSVMKLKFKMLTVKQVVSQIRSEDWFVTIDLKDAYFHVSILPQHRKFLRFAFRGEAYQYRVLPFGLALSPRTFTKCVDAALVPLRLQGICILNYIDGWLILAASETLAARHQDVVLTHMETLGLRLNVKKSVLSPLQRTTYLGVVWDSTTMQARLSPARIVSILTAVKRVKQGRSLTVKQFQQLLGLMAAASNVIPFGLLYMRLLQWWLKSKGFSPRGNPLRMIKVTRRGLRALDMWKKPWFLNQGPTLGAPCRRVTLATDASLTGWGAVMSGHPAQGLWTGRHLDWHINCLEMLAVFRALKYFLPDLRIAPCAGSHRQHSGGLLYQPPGRSAVAPLIQAGAPDPCVVPGQTPLSSSSSHSWAFECGSRHPVETGAEARGMDASPRGGGADMGDLWASPIRSLCHEGECTMSPLVLSSSSSSPGAGCYGALERVRRDGVSLLLVAPYWPGRVWFSDLISLLDGSPWEIPVRRDLLSQAGGHHPAPPSGVVEAVGVAPEGAQLIDSGLSTEVVETILQSRAPSTRKLYALKWKLFTSWCEERQQDPANCPVGTVLEFLQARFSTGLAHSTLKVYVAAISAYHALLDGVSVGKNPLVIRFLRGVLRLRPPTRPRVPTWDLTVTVLLLALTSLKRVGDLQALSVAPSYLEFSPGNINAFLYPRPGYVPKVPTHPPQPVVLQAFCPPPFREPDQQKLNCMCPVRALDAYVHRAALWRKSEQLFVCYGPPKKGSPASKETLSRWIVDAISTAYESSDLPSPLGVKAHSTRALGASKAFSAGVPIQDICNAAGCSFTRQGFGSLVAWASRSQSVLWTQLEFLKGNVPVTYVTLVPRGNETLRPENALGTPLADDALKECVIEPRESGTSWAGDVIDQEA
ncbi:Transposon Ty3-G Gag-Pol polyprotein [Labeo rohita]|uniref:ribonuclease H n=1 Tax=Labeo rohita TaxID=84645 RepID=A0ABQ8LSZ9_LABRO|nr:Transposon Ty3-G Gag-Pol polyprotein [Labeo rohita]